MSGPAVVLPKDALDRFLDECRDPSATALPAEAFGEAVPFELVADLELGGTPHTRSTYRHRLRRFLEWCAPKGLRPLPAHAETVRVYLGSLAANEHRWSTINVASAAIAATHVALGHGAPDSPALRHAIQLLRTYLDLDRRPSISSAMLATVADKCAGDALACRDRAILLTSHFGSLSPSRLAALDCKHAFADRAAT